MTEKEAGWAATEMWAWQPPDLPQQDDITLILVDVLESAGKSLTISPS
jgi:hypothetical protein